MVPWSVSLFLPYVPLLAPSLDTQTHPLLISLHPTSTMLTNFFFYCCSEYSRAPSPLIMPVRRKEAVFFSYPTTYSHPLAQKPQTLNTNAVLSVHLFMVLGPCSLSLLSPALFEAYPFESVSSWPRRL